MQKTKKNNEPRERVKSEESRSKKKEEEPKLVFFLLLQVMVVITVGAERERRRKRPRSIDILGFDCGSDGGAWRGCAATVPIFPEVLLYSS